MNIFLLKKLLLTFSIVFLSMFIFSNQTLAKENAGLENEVGQIAASETLEGKVVAISATGKESFHDELVEFQELEIEIIRGDDKGKIITIKHSAAGMGIVDVQYQQYEIGDKLKIIVDHSSSGEKTYFIDGQSKKDSLLGLLLLFILVVILVGRVWGLLSISGLAISFLVIFKFIIPSIIGGMNPIIAAIIGSIIIIPTTFYISHGFNKKSHVGIISTFIALIFTGFLAVYFVDKAHLTGFASEEAGFLQVERSGTIDIRGLLLAGIIIGTLGILDDVTIGQASAVRQLSRVNKNMDFFDLFKNGMKIGQDHISSVVNTLVLVYSGSALPLLLLFFGSNKGFINIIESELIAEEIVRMLVGSIGLISAAPLATIIAAYVFTKNKQA